MNDRQAIARAAAAGLQRYAAHAAKTPVMLGFDGFVDSIIAVVDTRHDSEHYQPIHTIADFGRKIVAAGGMSSNYEFVVKLEKLGGNGPIMANAMAAAGFDVTYIGMLGHPRIHPVFQPLTEIAHCLSVANPGLTDAVEFDDGKLMLGKLGPLSAVTWKSVESAVGAARIRTIATHSRLIGMVNWTMLPHMDDIWQHLIPVLQSGARKAKAAPRQLIFIDLADPEKRTQDDLREALALCTKMQKVADVILGVNLKESAAVAGALKVPVPAKLEPQMEALAGALRAKLNVYGVVIHSRDAASAARRAAPGTSGTPGAPGSTGAIESATFAGPFVRKPKLSTGGGDNFNSGFCLGLLAGLPLDQTLCAATATSGYYVRNAASPKLPELIRFCKSLPEPQST
jgi:sugar/nucleoside kinase (ribokinase family)